MTTKDFWNAYYGEWPVCEQPNCDVPAVVGDTLCSYRCSVHGRNEFVFQVAGEWFVDEPDDVPWIRIGETL